MAAESASRRLAELAVQLERAGVPRTEPIADEPPVVAGEELVTPAVLTEPGRHTRRRPGVGGRLGGWLTDRTPPWLHGRVALGRAHAATLLLTALAALALTAWLLHRPSASVERLAAAAEVTPTPPSTVAALVTPAATAASAENPAGVVVVDVAGKVRRPGVLTLPAGSRVTDAITHAGGPRQGVSLTSLNLARLLVDGEQILVGVSPAGGVAAQAAGAAGAASGADGPMVNLNTATLTELDSLPGVGPVTAQRILDWRDSHSAFSAVDELLEIDGIGEKTLARMASRVTL